MRRAALLMATMALGMLLAAGVASVTAPDEALAASSKTAKVQAIIVDKIVATGGGFVDVTVTTIQVDQVGKKLYSYDATTTEVDASGNPINYHLIDTYDTRTTIFTITSKLPL